MKNIKLFEEFTEKKHDFQDLLNFISDTDSKLITYLHTTKEEKTCQEIFEEGFQYEEFSNSTDETKPDMVELLYRLDIRKYYGNYIIIIQIPRSYPKPYDNLTTKKPFMGGDDGDQLIYTLPPRFVKGYYDKEKDIIIKNPTFNPT